MPPVPDNDNAESLPILPSPVAPRVLIGLVTLVLIFAGWQLQRRGVLSHPELLSNAATGHTPTAVGVFLFAYALSALAGIPTLPFNLAAGWLWGPIPGGALSALGAAIGATLSFTAARSLFGQPLRRRFKSPLLAWVQAEFDQKGWRFVAFIRLNPVFPTGPLNYLFGLTSIPARTYVCATAGSLLLPSIAVAWIGSCVAHFQSGIDPGRIMRVAIMVSAAVTLLIGIRSGARYLNYSRSKHIS